MKQDEAMLEELSKKQLENGLRELGLVLSADQQKTLLDYLALLIKWNKAFNLSGVKDAGEMLSRHLLDSLTLVPYIAGNRVLDVGTGPGLPGIPLAVCFPEIDFDLLDSNGKKTRFVFQAAHQLGLRNVHVHNIRVEKFQTEMPVDVIVCRAFSSLQDLAALTRHLLVPAHTRIVAMKGVYPEQELKELPVGIQTTRADRVSVPGYTGERHIIELTAQITE